MNLPLEHVPGPDSPHMKLITSIHKMLLGVPRDIVLWCLTNLLVSVLRSMHRDRRTAEQHFDQVSAAMKGSVMSAFDVLGRKKPDIILPGHH